MAHAQLEETTPANGSRLDHAPGAVELRFSEPVEAGLGAVRAFHEDGTRLDVGGVKRAGRVVRVALPQLDNGGYVVTWRVISADGHPVRGAFTFRVGRARPTTARPSWPAGYWPSGGSSRLAGALHAAARFGAFTGLILLVGGSTFALSVWPGGHRDRGVQRLISTGWGLTLMSTLAGIPLQAAYAGALGLGDAVRPTAIGDVIGTRFGTVWAVRLGLLALAVPLLALARRRGPTGAVVVCSMVLGVALLATPGLSGHAGAGDLVPLAMLADVAHLGAISVWLGSLTALALVVLRRRDRASIQAAVPRFSTAAVWSVGVIVASGAFQSWRQVGSVSALTETTFGRLLIVKLVLFAGLVGLGALGRRVVNVRMRPAVPALSAGAMAAPVEVDDAAITRLRRSVTVEVAIGAAVLAVTALLVNLQPARSALAQPVSISFEGKAVLVDLTVDPARRGPVDLHVYTLSPTGQVLEVEELTLQLRQSQRGVEPIDVPLTVAGPGHFAAYGYELPLAGEWQVEVVARLNDFDQERLEGRFKAR